MRRELMDKVKLNDTHSNDDDGIDNRRSGSGGLVDDRQNSGIISKLIITLVEQRVGEAGVAALLELAGESRSLEVLKLDDTWSSYAQGKALFEAAAEVLGDPRAPLHIGEVILDQYMATNMAAMIQSFGSPAAIMPHLNILATKYSTTIDMATEEIGDNFAVVSARSIPNFPRYGLLCDFTMGMLSQVPVLFGLGVATVVEDTCETRGDDACRFRVSWVDDSRVSLTPECQISSLENQVTILQARIDALQATTTDLVSANDIETLSQRIINRASSVMRCPHFLLTVRPFPGAGLSVYSTEMSAECSQEIAEGLRSDSLDSEVNSFLVVEVASARREYGHLVAIQPAGTHFLDFERIALSRYANLAAVVLDAVTTGEELRAQTHAAQALFDLTRDLAAVSSVKEVAYRVATMVPRMLPTHRVAVWIWDDEMEGLCPVGFSGVDQEEVKAMSDLILRPHESIVLDMMISDHEPVLLGVEFRDAYLENLFGELLSGHAVLVPVIAGGRFQGMISASVGEATELLEDEGLLECLRSLADQTSMAFTNARLVERVRHQAMHDSLTGLPNQRLFEDRVRHGLATSRRSGEPVGLFFLDLDRFKAVNDSLGHGAGDDLLAQVANRLTMTMREEDTVARVGGDEFVILVANAVSVESLEALALRVQDSLRESFILGAQVVSISSSVGIVLADATVDDYQSLVRYADVAMYRAKSQGRDRYVVYSPAIDQRINNQLKLEGDLHQALARDELHVLYQPMVELTTMQIVGVEALVRWDHPKLGLLTPDAFVPMAEETGLIVPVDAWVLQAACRQAHLWRKAGFPPLRISVNLSVQDLRNPDLAETVAAVLLANEVDPAMLELEIGERFVDGEDPDILSALERLKAIGVKIAIDDFGTGGSGLRQLRSLPIDTLKIDKSFVQELTAEQGEAPMLAAMISMAHDLRVLTIAEGVESVQQGSFLRGKGCDLAQGYFFSHPITPEAITRLLEQR
ncbi:MAG: EAL domain-containing protein [Acidimicrobiales bacterium]